MSEVTEREIHLLSQVMTLKRERDELSDERNALRAENAALKAQWEAIPWDALTTIDALHGTWKVKGGGRMRGVSQETYNILGAWLDAYAPKEEPHP